MKNENNRAIPLDFKLWAVFATYTLAMVAVILFGLSLGARLTWMIGAFLLGLLAGLPAARWELAAITESWEEILCGPKISLRLVYFDRKAREGDQIFPDSGIPRPDSFPRLDFCFLLVSFSLADELLEIALSSDPLEYVVLAAVYFRTGFYQHKPAAPYCGVELWNVENPGEKGGE